MKLMLCNAPPEAAQTIAETVVEGGLAACVNLIGPVRSIYRWEGKLCRDEEVTLLIKVADERVEALRQKLLEAHPYDCPELLCLPVDEALSHGPYVAWVEGR